MRRRYAVHSYLIKTGKTPARRSRSSLEFLPRESIGSLPLVLQRSKGDDVVVLGIRPLVSAEMLAPQSLGLPGFPCVRRNSAIHWFGDSNHALVVTTLRIFLHYKTRTTA
jgi:hypothetical protein